MRGGEEGGMTKRQTRQGKDSKEKRRRTQDGTQRGMRKNEWAAHMHHTGRAQQAWKLVPSCLGAHHVVGATLSARLVWSARASPSFRPRRHSLQGGSTALLPCHIACLPPREGQRPKPIAKGAVVPDTLICIGNPPQLRMHLRQRHDESVVCSGVLTLAPRHAPMRRYHGRAARTIHMLLDELCAAKRRPSRLVLRQPAPSLSRLPPRAHSHPFTTSFGDRSKHDVDLLLVGSICVQINGLRTAPTPVEHVS